MGERAGGVCKARAWADWQDNVGICSVAIVLRLEEEEERGWLLLGPGWRGCKRRVDFAEYFMSGEICTHVQSYALG